MSDYKTKLGVTYLVRFNFDMKYALLICANTKSVISHLSVASKCDVITERKRLIFNASGFGSKDIAWLEIFICSLSPYWVLRMWFYVVAMDLNIV